MAGASFAVKHGKVEEACRLLEEHTASGDVAASVLFVRQGSAVVERAFGKAKNTEAVFLLASITKPMTTTALMTLVDAGGCLVIGSCGSLHP